METFSLTDDQYAIIAYAYYLGVDKKNFVPIYLIKIDATFDEVKGTKIALGSLYDGSREDNFLSITDPRFQNTAWFTTYGKNRQVYNSFFPSWNDGILSVENVPYTDDIGRTSYSQKVTIIPKNYTFKTQTYTAFYPSSLASNGRFDGLCNGSLLFLWVVETSDGQYFTTNLGQNIVLQNNITLKFDKSGPPPIILASDTTKGSLTPGSSVTFRLYGVDERARVSGEAIAYLLGLSKRLTPEDIHDPNPGGGDSKPSGGGGGGDIGGDTNPDDGLPTISALDSGLLTAYNPNVGQLQSLGRFLWSDSFDLDSFKKLFNDPFDTLLGLSVVPVKPNTSGTKNIMFGNMDSGVSAPVVSNQWVTKDMGSVTLNEVWHGALDYAPATGVTIYLPFIGMRQLNVNDVMGSTLHLIYKFDVLTGSCVAQIYVNHNHQGNKDDGFSWTKNQGLLYEFIGQCAENIPLASQDFTNTIRAAIGGVAVATGAAASIATGNPALGIAGLTVGAANLGMQASTPTVERGGHLSGSASILGYSQPFLIVERPHQCKPSRYYALRGVPSQVYTSKLSNCTNFTQITANNNLHVAGASDTELAELQNLLVAGVYFPSKKR